MTNHEAMPREETAEAIAAAALSTPLPSAQSSKRSVATTLRTGSKGPQISQEIRGSVLLVTVHQEEIQDELTVGPLRYTLREQLEQTFPRLEVFDLGVVTLMSSRAVGVFLAHNQALGRQGGKMR